MSKHIYDDGIYCVTTAIVSTPSRFYPIANTTASIRRDPLWTSLGVAGFSALCVAIYGDLLWPVEIAALAGVSAASVIAGSQFAILRIHSLGHARTMIFGRRYRLRELYRAIREARSTDLMTSLYSENNFE